VLLRPPNLCGNATAWQRCAGSRCGCSWATKKSPKQFVIRRIVIHCGVRGAVPVGVRGRSGPARGDRARRFANFGRCSSEIVFLFHRAKGGTSDFGFLRGLAVGGTRRSDFSCGRDEVGTRRSSFLWTLDAEGSRAADSLWAHRGVGMKRHGSLSSRFTAWSASSRLDGSRPMGSTASIRVGGTIRADAQPHPGRALATGPSAPLLPVGYDSRCHTPRAKLLSERAIWNSLSQRPNAQAAWSTARHRARRGTRSAMDR
jgi:hypothetical protein